MSTRETAPSGSGAVGQHRFGSAPYGTGADEPYGSGADAGMDAGRVEREPVAAAAGAGIADPGPLGLAGFAATTFVLSLFNAKIIDNSSLEAVVLPLALFYGGLAQLLAGMWEFKKANTFGATAFGTFGAFWLAFAAYVKFVVPSLPAADAHEATGTFLLVFAVFTTYMIIASLRVSGAIAAVFIALAATFIVLTIGNLGDHTNIVKVGGWLGLVTAVLA